MDEARPVEIPARTWIVWAVAINLLIALTRIIALRHSTLDLLPDEAQYWSWSRHPAFGYFSKPPMIAWIIGAVTAAVGDDEWGVRLAAPLIHAATGTVIALAGRALFDARIGFWSALLYATLPGVSFSGLIISTDAPLLFFWALALLAFAELWRKPRFGWGALLGLAFGLGFLSKYAMGYFLPGLAALAAIGPRAWIANAWRQLLLALAVAAAVIAPNLAWNAAHGWATVGHTAANASWGEGAGLHLQQALEFAGAQFGVFGPVLLIVLLTRIALWQRDPPEAPERLLLAFTLPVLALMVVQSGISRAHANWAAVAYVPATILVVAWLERRRRIWPLKLSLALQVAVFAAFTLLFAGSLPVRLTKSVDIFHQMRGWRSLAGMALRRIELMPDGTSLAAEDREVMAELDYYLRERPFPLVMAVGGGPPGNQYELERAVNAQTGGNVLLISRWPDRTDILDRFAGHTMLEEWTVSAGPGRLRHYYVFELSGFQG